MKSAHRYVTRHSSFNCCPTPAIIKSAYLTMFSKSSNAIEKLDNFSSIRKRYHDNDSPDRRRFILKETELTRNHLTPELALHLITRNCRLWKHPIRKDEDIPFKDPFWAFYWPGGQALTRYILDNPLLVKSKIVLDVGSGCGAASIACLLSGAEKVIANDIDTDAMRSLELNMESNGLENVDKLAKISTNMIGARDNIWDVILLGDMFYDEQFSNHVCDWLDVLLDDGKTILIGDPGRLSFNKSRSARGTVFKLAEYDMDWQNRIDSICNGFSSGYVWKWSKG